VNETALPLEVASLKAWAADGYPLAALGNTPELCLAWLKAEYVQ
jgi:hypothetical protein